MKKVIINIVSDEIKINQHKVLDWKKRIETEFTCDDIFSLNGSPFQAIIVTKTNESPREIAFKIGNAFNVVGKKSGRLLLELTEFDNTSMGFEAPPFFEHEIPLKNILAKTWFTDSGRKEISLTLYKSKANPENYSCSAPTSFTKKQIELIETRLEQLHKIRLIEYITNNMTNRTGVKIIFKPIADPDILEIEREVTHIAGLLNLQPIDLKIQQTPVYSWKNPNEN